VRLGREQGARDRPERSHSDGLSPEEAAITVRENPGGLTYDDDPGYLDDAAP